MPIDWLSLVCHPRGAVGRYMYIYAVNSAHQLSLCEVQVYPVKRKYTEEARVICWMRVCIYVEQQQLLDSGSLHKMHYCMVCKIVFNIGFM